MRIGRRSRGRRTPRRPLARRRERRRRPGRGARTCRRGGRRSRLVRGDGELLARDLLERVAEHVRVLEPDVREQDDARAKHVRRVVPPAEPGLDDGDVDAGVGEGGERGSGDDLELRRLRAPRPPAVRDATAASKSASCPSRRIRSLQLATCGEIVAPDREPVGEKQLLDRDRRGRLAVRPDDVDRRVRVLRVAERGEQRAHALEPEAVARPGAQSSRATRPRSPRHRRATLASPREPPRRRARGGSARASRAPRSTTSAGAFATNRSFASIASARATSFRSRSISASRLSSDSDPLRANDGGEDAPLVVRAELDLHAAPAEDLRGLLHAVERARIGREAVVGLGPRRRRSGASRGSGSCDQISSVTCGMHRVEQREQPLECGERGRDRSASSRSYRRGLIASAYQSQKSSKVRW